MLFYELACHPEIFNKNYLLENSVGIKAILKNITEKGSIANLENGKWKDIIEDKISFLDDYIPKEYNLKKQLQIFLKTLKTRRRFICYENTTCKEDWLDIIYSYDKEEFSAILHTQTTTKTYDAEDLLDSQLWEDITKTSTKYDRQNEEYIKSEIAPVLHNARKIDLIDPYFDITKEKYKKPFDIIIDELKKTNSNQYIDFNIHIKNKNKNIESNAVDRKNYLDEWKKTCEKCLSLKIKCVLYVWHESSNDEMHDRHIIRDESFGATLPTGVDERKKNKTMWHDMGYDNVDDVLNDFREESSPFELKAKVTAEGIYYLLRKNDGLVKLTSDEYIKYREVQKEKVKSFKKKP